MFLLFLPVFDLHNVSPLKLTCCKRNYLAESRTAWGKTLPVAKSVAKLLNLWHTLAKLRGGLGGWGVATVYTFLMKEEEKKVYIFVTFKVMSTYFQMFPFYLLSFLCNYWIFSYSFSSLQLWKGKEVREREREEGHCGWPFQCLINILSFSRKIYLTLVALHPRLKNVY